LELFRFREHEILREEVRSLQEVRAKLQTRVQDLEDEIKRLKDEAEKGRKEKEEEDEEVPMAQRKRFTR
jgi:mitogen-activated protein kinase 8 interacting protein 3